MKTLWTLALAALVACGKPGASATVDSTGGAVALPGGPSLQIPAGALSAATTIGIEESGAAAPAGALTKVYKFTPEGQTFNQPVNVIFPVSGSGAGAALYWTKLNSTTDYDAIDVTVTGGNATGQVTHFSQGVLVAGRDLSGAFTEAHQPDTGAATTLAATQSAGETVSATVPMKSNSTGYMSFPGTLKNDGTFTVPGVPSGTYFLTITPPSPPVSMFEATSATPDLSEAVSTRVDLVTAGGGTRLAMALTGLDPWAAGDSLQTISSQAGVGFSGFGGANPPANAATTYNGIVAWTGGLPNASKGDTVYFLQSVAGTAGTGTLAGTISTLKSCAAATNLTLTDRTTSSSPSTALTTQAPPTGSLGANVLYSQFEALLPAINPNAKRSAFRMSVVAKPHAVAFPDEPNSFNANLYQLDVPLASLAAAPADTDYGAQPYAQCLDPLWKESRGVTWSATVPIAGTTITDFVATISSVDPMSPAPPAGVGPAIGPVKSPLVSGKDAFTPQTGVTVGPTISWTAPAVGTATAYTVSLYDAATKGALLSATVYTRTSFQVPPGVLAAGRTYFAVITARAGAFYAVDAAPRRTGQPRASADCVTAAFSP